MRRFSAASKFAPLKSLHRYGIHASRIIPYISAATSYTCVWLSYPYAYGDFIRLDTTPLPYVTLRCYGSAFAAAAITTGLSIAYRKYAYNTPRMRAIAHDIHEYEKTVGHEAKYGTDVYPFVKRDKSRNLPVAAASIFMLFDFDPEPWSIRAYLILLAGHSFTNAMFVDRIDQIRKNLVKEDAAIKRIDARAKIMLIEPARRKKV